MPKVRSDRAVLRGHLRVTTTAATVVAAAATATTVVAAAVIAAAAARRALREEPMERRPRSARTWGPHSRKRVAATYLAGGIELAISTAG